MIEDCGTTKLDEFKRSLPPETAQFLDAMENPAFVRLSYNTGAICNHILVVDRPPEEFDGFFDAITGDVIDLLCPPRDSLWARFKKIFKKLIEAKE